MALHTDLRALKVEVGELLASHDRARSLDSFAKYADDPVGFILNELHADPVMFWSRQREIAESVRDNRYTVVRSSNSVGKDWVAARLALWWVYARGGYVLVTGPTERQVKHVVMGEVRRAFNAAADLPGTLYELALRVEGPGQIGILGFTSTDASRLTGFHAPRLMVIVTEAQGIEDLVWEGIFANVTGDDSKILAVGNPLSPIGKFYDVSRSPTWTSLRIAASEHPNLLQGKTVVPGAVTQKFVDLISDQYGTDSPIYMSRVLGEFPDTAEDALVKRALIHRANERYADLCHTDASWDAPWVFGIDIARLGGDRSVIAAMQARIVRRFIPLPPTDTMATVEAIHRECLSRGIMRRQEGYKVGRREGKLVCDAAGIGAGVHDRLKQMGYHAIEFNGGSAPTELERSDFANKRAEGFWKLREALERDEIAFPKDEMLEEELCTTLWSENLAGKIAIEPKDRIRERIGRSPDVSDALSMAVWETRRRKLSGGGALVTL